MIDTAPVTELRQALFSYLRPFVHAKGGTIKNEGTLESSFRFIVQYGGTKKLKLEFSTSSYANVYEKKLLLGVPVQTMDIRRMFAHKLCAFVARYQQRRFLANRDIFDIHFLFKSGIQPAEDIIRTRSLHLTGTALTTQERYAYLFAFIEKHRTVLQKNILDGLGELLDEREKIPVKTSLLEETQKYLALHSMS